MAGARARTRTQVPTRLALGGLIAAGVAGLDAAEPDAGAPPPTDLNMFDAADERVRAARAAAAKLPQNLSEALGELERCAAARATLGDAFVDSYVKLRRAHWEEYCAHISRWELETYLDA